MLISCAEIQEGPIATQIAQIQATIPAVIGTEMVPLQATAGAIATEQAGVFGTMVAKGEESIFATLVAAQNSDAMATAQATLANTEIVARGSSWVVQQVGYGGPDQDGYRADCSGFVSYAWQLPPRGPDTTRFHEYSEEIPIEQLQAGDAINNQRPSDDGHMILFVAWVDEDNKKFQAYDMNLNPGYTTTKQFTWVLRDIGWTILELEDNTRAKGTYVAQRRTYVP